MPSQTFPTTSPVIGKDQTNIDINVDFTRQEVTNMRSKWQLITDCINGQETIKCKGEVYLPRPNPSDTSKENHVRYESYKNRALFYNLTRRTLVGMMGQVYSRKPIVKLPDSMIELTNDIDGDSVSLDQQAEQALGFVMSLARCGILVDYPVVDGATTLKDQQENGVRPTITLYNPYAIINWRHKLVGNERRLSLVVIKESYLTGNDGFETSYEQSWRVLRLNDQNQCTVEVFVFDEVTRQYINHIAPRFVLKGDGTPFDRIPFQFIGVMNNNATPDEPQMYDLATLNIAHYRNSADYEDSCYLVGQPTPFFTGLTQQWVENVLKGTVQMGSRSAIPLPQGATAGLLQVQANSMPFEAMKHKEAQAVALGARLVTTGGTQQTLGEAQIEESSETSILATAANNVSAAYTLALTWAAQMFNVPSADVSYSLNTDFPASRLTPAEMQQLVLSWQNGAIAWEEMRAGLRRAGIATVDDQKARQDIKANPPLVLVPGATVDPLTGEVIPPAGGLENGGNGGTQKAQKVDPTHPNNGGNQSGN